MRPDTHKIIDIVSNYVSAKAVIVAAYYELDKHLDEQGMLVSELAKKLTVNESALWRLLTLLEAHGIVACRETYVERTDLTAQLKEARSPHLLKGYKAFEALDFSISHNLPAWDKVFGQPFYQSLDDEEIRLFADWCQHSGDAWLTGLYRQFDFSRYATIVDIGGGQGHVLAEILSHHPSTRGILFDQASILEQASTVFAEKKCLDRVECRAGDFFKAVPDHGDLYLICRTLLNWSDEQAIELLKTCVRHMPAAANLLIVDFVLPDKQHPRYLQAVEADLNLLVCLHSQLRSRPAWEALIHQSDLQLVDCQQSDAAWQSEPFAPVILLTCRKR